MATTEHTINDALAEFLRSTRSSWRDAGRVSSENTQKLQGSAERPDILISEPNASPVVVETEVLPALTVEPEARSRLGKKLAANGRTILSAVAVRMPSELRTKQSKALEAEIRGSGRFEFCLFTGESSQNCQRWPKSGWLVGGAEELSLVVQAAAVPPAVIEAAADSLIEGVSAAAGILAELGSSNPGVTVQIAQALHQEDGEQTLRMACTILANAFVFQETLAGGPGGLAGIKTFDQLSGAGKLTKAGILSEWRAILKVNYWPIFDVARRILEGVPSSHTKPLIGTLSETANKLLENRLMRSHDLTGAVFQRLIADRKFLAAYYTTPASATFLAGLAIHKSSAPGGGLWKDAVTLKSIKVADFACGTGTLLSAAYQRLGQLHELAGGDSEKLHSKLMSDCIFGCDVLPAAAHLTASMLAGAHPTTTFSESGVMTLEYGKQGTKGNVSIALGSLDLLDQQRKMDIVSVAASALTGKGTAAKEVWRDLPAKSFNLILMNPPFTRPTGHEASKIGVPNPMFAAFSSSEEEQRLMGKAMKERTEDTCYHGNAGEGSAFLALADRKIAVGGTIGLILPQSLLTGDAWNDCRDLIAKNYTEVVLVSIAGEGGGEVSFSADTAIGECIVVGTRDPAGTKRATFVVLKNRPEYPLQGQYAAREISRLLSTGSTKKLEDGPVGGTEIKFGQDVIGSLIEAPLPSGGGWNLSRVNDFALAQTAYALEATGKVWLPSVVQPSAKALPMNTVGNIGNIGPYHADVNGKTSKGGVRGPFDVRPCVNQSAASYPVLWAVDAGSNVSIQFDGDSEGIVKTGKTVDESQLIAKKVAEIVLTKSNCHFNRDFRFNSQALSMQYTPRATIGGRSWLSIKLPALDQEKALVLWANTTLGLLMHWWHSNKSQPGRSSIGKNALETLAVLDVTKLGTEEIAQMSVVFDKFKSLPLKPVHQIDTDANRHDLDAAVLKDALHMDTSIFAPHGPLAVLRAKLAAEPSIRGDK